MEAKDQSHYNEEYYQWNGQSGDRPALSMYFRILKRYVKSGAVLEDGAGEGYLIKRFANAGYDTFAYDFSEYSRQIIRKNTPNTTVYDNDEDFKPESVDGLICLHTLEHIPEPPTKLKLFSRSLKKGGYMLFVVPNTDALGHKIKKEKWFGYRDKTHVSLLPVETWKRYVNDAGFEILGLYSDGFWDSPYLPLVPNFVQKLIFLPTSALMYVMGRLIYPSWFGEDLVVLARKK